MAQPLLVKRGVLVWLLLLARAWRGAAEDTVGLDKDQKSRLDAAIRTAQLGQDEDYPSNALQCVSTMTHPDERVICPEAENKWCAKIVDDRKDTDCGKDPYFLDRWQGSDCRLKKCTAHCERMDVYYYTADRGRIPGKDSQHYTASTGGFIRQKRMIYCCNDQNYCNSASSFPRLAPFLFALAAVAASLCIVR